MTDEAARNYGLPDASGLAQAGTTTAEIIQQYYDVVDASRRTLADGTTGLSLPKTGAGPALAVKPAATTTEAVGSRDPAEHQADPKQQLFEQNVRELAALIQTESGGVRAAKATVGWTLINRVRRNHVTAVHQAWHGSQHSTPPKPDTLDLARRLLSGDVPDPTSGATHFYTPKIMPREGDEKSGSPGYLRLIHSDTRGGLEQVKGLDVAGTPIRSYRPGYAASPLFEKVTVPGVKEEEFEFYKALGTGRTR